MFGCLTRKKKPVTPPPVESPTEYVDLYAELVELQSAYEAKGIREVPRNSNRDPGGFIAHVQKRVSGSSGNFSYCACGACCGVLEIGDKFGFTPPLKPDEGVNACYDRNGALRALEPKVGFLICYTASDGSWHGHMGTVVRIVSDKQVETIEWNILGPDGNGGVYRKLRNRDGSGFTAHKLRGYLDPFRGVQVKK